MSINHSPRLASILQANKTFKAQIFENKLPARQPDSLAVITCMDPRINLEALGIQQFSADGAGHSAVRIIRTIGGMADERSLIIGLFLAGIRELVVLMHTDCGCCLAHSKIDTLIENMQDSLTPNQLKNVHQKIGAPFRDRLQAHLKTFENPIAAVKQEVERLKQLPFVPEGIIVHGLVYDVATGDIEVVVSG